MKDKFLSSALIINDDNLDLGVLQFFNNLDAYIFNTKRFYTISNVKSGVVRGHHAHKRLHQIIFCAYGRIKVSLSDGCESVTHILDNPSQIIYVEPMIWHTMEWLVDDSVLVVLASENYDESDYIRDYNEFLRLSNNEKSPI
jgi:dTDP-4-dehydrorhamnose 3,5-epimerase-like enzyme